MGKKSRLKKERRKKKAEPVPSGDDGVAEEVGGAGDLRLVEAHVEHFVLGVEEAETALRMLGRDACVPVAKLGASLDNDKVVELGQQLVAMRPQVETNLYPLRDASVVGLVESARSTAPQISDQPSIGSQTAGVGLFDPMNVKKSLVRTGRPRTNAERVGAGDVAWFPLDHAASVEVELALGPPPEGQATSALRLRVSSGVIFVGPPEASDGPRLGTVRLDPFSTPLNDFVERGVFRLVQPGDYEVHAYRFDGDKVRIHLTSTEQLADDPIEPASIAPPPAKTQA